MRHFFSRHQPPVHINRGLIAGIGGLVAIAAVGALTGLVGHPMLMAPFGASCVLIFSVASSPLSQPANVVGGHVVATLVGLILRAFFPNEWWAVAIAVGAAIALMAALRITHPPAGANPLVVFAADPGFEFLLFPVLTVRSSSSPSARYSTASPGSSIRL
jgi:CBS-domain-containing membrane protein